MSATNDKLTMIIESLTPDECKSVLIDMASRSIDVVDADVMDEVYSGCIREIIRIVNVCSCDSDSGGAHKPSCRLNGINKL